MELYNSARFTAEGQYEAWFNEARASNDEGKSFPPGILRTMPTYLSTTTSVLHDDVDDRVQAPESEKRDTMLAQDYEDEGQGPSGVSKYFSWSHGPLDGLGPPRDSK